MRFQGLRIILWGSKLHPLGPAFRVILSVSRRITFTSISLFLKHEISEVLTVYLYCVPSLCLLVQAGSVSAGITFPETCESQVYIRGIHCLRQEAPPQVFPGWSHFLFWLLLRRWRGCMSHMPNLFKEPLCDLILWAFDISEVLAKGCLATRTLGFHSWTYFPDSEFPNFSSFCNQDMPRISPNFQVLIPFLVNSSSFNFSLSSGFL